MAGIENMAEGTPGPGPEAPTLYIANSSGTVVGRRPIGPEQPSQAAPNIDVMAAAIARALDERQRLGQQQRIPERPWQGESDFQATLRRVAQAEGMPETTPTEISAKQAELQAAREARDTLLVEANNLGLFNSLKTELSGIYYSSRVMVTNNEKEGREEFQGHGRLQQLQARRQVAYDHTLSLEVDVADERIGGSRRGFWVGQPANLAQRYGGVVDYFHQNSMNLIYEVVRNRKRYTSEDIQNGVVQVYPPTGIVDIWDGPVRDSGGHMLKDEEGNEINADNFIDFRVAIEERRRSMPWVPNRADYDTYIRFVADDAEELEEMIPYIVARVRRKLGTGQPDQLHQRLGQEKEKMDSALTKFAEQLVPSEREFRRLKSILDDNLNLMGAYYFSEKVRDDWGPYIAYMGFLADATQDTEQQDHLVDALILDRDGLIMLACNQFLVDDGIFWRYGQKSADIATKTRDVSKLFIWQKNRRQEINRFLMGKRLKGMQNLLSNHQAFQRLKADYDRLDEQDKVANNGNILDVNGQPTIETRWQEYCKKALEWEKTGKYGDPRDPERVIFQHPLARTFKAPTKNAAGQVESEFLDMFEDDDRVETDKWYASIKRRKVRSTMEVAERLCRVMMLDSAAALAWHVFRTQGEVDEVNEYLVATDMDPVTIREAVPQKTLYRVLMQACIREDRKKQPKDRAFKMYDLLTQRLGLDLDIPLFAAWYLGWHDTGRPSVILQAIAGDNRPGGLNTPGVMPAQGKDEKNTGTSWVEKERRLGILMHLVIKAKFGPSGRYVNFPGHDTPGAGVKDKRNYLNLMFGTSRDTVWLNDLLDKVGFPVEQEWPRDFGITRDPITQLVALHKWGNEIVFAQSGYAGAIESPRDMKSWVKRTGTNVKQSKILTTGDKEFKEGFALMKDGPLAGGYRWRDFDLTSVVTGDPNQTTPRLFAIDDPVKAIKDINEATYRAGIDLASQVIRPTIDAMQNVVDSTSGPNPGTARFVRTLMWYGISKWMDTSWEFRQKPGYAFDANLYVARYFMHQYLLEYGDNGLIYTDEEFDEIMLGYTRDQNGTSSIRYKVKIDGNRQLAKDNKGNWVVEKEKNDNGQWVTTQIIDQNGKKMDVSEEGLIDAFPENLRDEILAGKELKIRGKNQFDGQEITVKDYILPFGLNSKFPETLANYYRDKESVQRDYEGALKRIQPRKKVTRP